MVLDGWQENGNNLEWNNLMISVILENRAWRGLRVYTPYFEYDGNRLCLEITTHALQGPIVIQKYWDYNENGKRHSYGGYIKENFKTSIAIEFLLTVGMNSQKITFKMIDLGVKPQELGLAMALAFKNTDDKWLSDIDKDIKKIVIENHSQMIKELEELLQ